MPEKLPAIHLYPGDWLRDAVSGCSLAAQGLWLRMMFLGHDSDRYGYLATVDGSPIPPDALARRCGCSLDQYEALIAELLASGVPSCTPEGVIYSRRMVRDAQAREDATKRQRRKRRRDKLLPENSVTHLSQDSNERVTPNEVEDENDKKLVLDSPELNAPKPRARDEIWDTICEVFSIDARAKTNAARVGKLVREFKAIHATADEIKKRAAAYRQKMPDFAFTPDAVFKHWGSLNGQHGAISQSSRERSEFYDKLRERGKK